MYLERAAARDSSNWIVWANLATISFLEDRLAQGQEELLTALSLRNGQIDPKDRANTPYLDEALARSGLKIEDLQW